MNTATGLYVRSHVARDLLQNAGLFKTDKLVVWEYVSNGLQYIGPGTNPVVKVSLDSKKKKIAVQDNGRGMDWSGLQNFFVMHGENIDRKEGRPGRGRFGTGKSAVFGIGEVLRITTVRNGKRSKVELRRTNIAKMTSEDPIPVEILEKEVPTASLNGTLIEMEGINLRSLDQAGIIHFIERHLARWPKNATVFVNNHECEFTEPPIASEHRFTPNGMNADFLGDVELVIKVSKSPLDEDLRGISIFSKGVWHETTLAGSEGREMAQYIFGELDVPKLDEDKSPIAPFDVSRSMRLNLENDLVRAVHSFVGTSVEEVRRGLQEEEKARRAEEDAKKLAQQAAEIAKVINEDFDAFRQRVAKVRAKTRGSSDLNQNTPTGGQQDDDLIFGSELPAKQSMPQGGPGGGQGEGGGPEAQNQNPAVEPAQPEAPKLGRPSGGRGSTPKPAGGFRIEFSPMGIDSPRAQYVPDERTIYINLEHPQLAAAKGLRPIDDPVFRRLAYEVAFSEYAIALAQELARRDEYLDPTDPIFDIRDTMNRIARRGAALYAE
jgi:hypothetical protein